MSGFCILRGERNRLEQRRAEVERLTEALGLPVPTWLDLPDGVVAFWPWLLRGEPGLWRGVGDDFALAAGNFIFDEMTGTPALAAFCHAAGTDPRRLLARTNGQFALLLRRGHQAFLLHDRLGFYQLFHDADHRVIATSFLLAARLLGRRHVDPIGLLDYVLSGVPLGEATLVEELRTLAPTVHLVFDTMSVGALQTPSDLPGGSFYASREEAETACLTALRRTIATGLAAHGGEVACALSGGYDSRLLLALLREQGVTPRLFVYGGPDAGDVRHARMITAGEQLPLDHVDKRTLATIDPETFADTVHANFLAQDGYGQEGIFDNGGERHARSRRIAAAPLQLHGSGGETLRNFFYLPDRPISARHLAWSFWGQFDPAALVPPLDEAAYFAALARKIEQAVGQAISPLPRPWIEWLYPNFRCRAWVGRETSNNQRFSPVLAPFLEPESVAAALQVPLAMKQHGAFEAGLIVRVSPRLAAYPSNYGHGFDRPPPLRRRLADSLTLYRPPRLRKWAFRAKSRFGHRAPLPPALSEPFLKAVLPDGPVLVRRYLNPERIIQADQVQRLWSAEYLLRWLDMG